MQNESPDTLRYLEFREVLRNRVYHAYDEGGNLAYVVYRNEHDLWQAQRDSMNVGSPSPFRHDIMMALRRGIIQ